MSLMQANGSVTAHRKSAEHYIESSEIYMSRNDHLMAIFCLGKAWGNLEWVKLQKKDPLQARLDSLFVKLGLR